ncbi:MAG: FtsX-like permease family protein [Clostridium sp.]|nr:FtsX-like permease family protein [Clostridium sp.]
MIKKDLRKNKAINIVLLFFVAISACLISVGFMITVQLFQSINSMYEIAKPPHFMQMHVGEFDPVAVENFAKQNDYVKDWQIIDIYNVDGSNISIQKENQPTVPMAGCMLDLGMMEETEKYDLLLDMNNKPYYPEKGEIGVPVMIQEQYNVEVGDVITISDGKLVKNLTVTKIIRDSQMNSSMCSSTRFLLNPEDLQELRDSGMGETEYLIEYYFDSTSQANKFQAAYENAGMPMNGQAITYPIIRLVSGLSDLLTVVLLVLVSVLLIFIAGLCLRFTILSAIEEDVTEIGVMKAIGLAFKDIREIYLQKYRLLVAIGCLAGYFLSLLADKIFISRIEKNFGATKLSAITLFVPILFVLLVYALDVSLCKKILKKIKDISVIDTIRGNITVDGKNNKKKTRKAMDITRCKISSVNVSMGLKSVLQSKKTWFMMFFILFIATCIITIPLNLFNTFKSERFVTYMGQNDCDMLIETTSRSEAFAKYNDVMDLLAKDSDVSDFSYEAYVVYNGVNKEDENVNVHVACASDSKSELQFVEGKCMQQPDEIALSVMNADTLGVKTGDQLTLSLNGKEQTFKVSGIYQDVTNGGYTSKVVMDYNPEDVYKYAFEVNYKDGVDVNQKADLYTDQLGQNVNVKELKEFVSQTLGGVTTQLGKAVMVINLVAIGLAMLITILFMKLLMTKERTQVAILKTIGFSIRDLKQQYMFKTCFVSLLGIILGLVCAVFLGEGLVSLIIGIANLGIVKITFFIKPLEVYILYPGMLLLAVIVSTISAYGSLKKSNIVELIKE